MKTKTYPKSGKQTDNRFEKPKRSEFRVKERLRIERTRYIPTYLETYQKTYQKNIPPLKGYRLGLTVVPTIGIDKKMFKDIFGAYIFERAVALGS